MGNRTKKRNYERSRKNNICSAKFKDTTSTKHDATVPTARWSDATISAPMPSKEATDTAANSVKKNTKQVPTNNRCSKKF